MPPTKLNPNISSEDADLFFRLMWTLQTYVNRRLNVIPGVTSDEDYAELPAEEKLKVRDALWSDVNVIDAFIAENPANLTVEELQIVQNWKCCVTGDFYLVRFLKRHAIFVSADDSAQVYGVSGLYELLQDVTGGWPPPIMLSAVLLPFKGRIIYDGLLLPYSVLIGPGIAGELKELYQHAKDNGTIIEALEPGVAAVLPAKAKKPKRDWGLMVDSIVETTGHLKTGETRLQTNAFKMLKLSALLAQAAVNAPDNFDELDRLANKLQRAFEQVEMSLHYARFD